MLISDWFCKTLCSPPPQWDPVHSVKGVLYTLSAEIEEPFEAWIDELRKQSRIDYYDGTVKTYQLSQSRVHGTSLKVVAVTTDQEPNRITCLQVNGTEHRQIKYQPILPDCKEFQFRNSEELLGWKCDKFVYEEIIDRNSQKYTMWVRYVEMPDSTRKPIPIRFEVLGWDNLIGAHYDHYHLDYNNYSSDEIPDAIYTLNTGKSCVGFPGPGVEHYAIFNPMNEFVHPVDSSHIYLEHKRFMNIHGVAYATTDERMTRQNVFMQNLRYIHSKNREHLGFSLTVNALADRTQDEIESIFKKNYYI
ncbi:uncharacterized protein LOC129565667 [Sitodiplosis mosellana]|uniref:uncharacterized protein LOC129565667 n=1 Tax=Sitodiplosis mosellana TaxID=263140 RepID=UPI002444B66E|nr:uncharacterized protein LOC129565667 [Sitodiplosis mosellana]